MDYFLYGLVKFKYNITSGQIITTSAEVTLNGGLVRESPRNPLNSGLGIILICPDNILGFYSLTYTPYIYIYIQDPPNTFCKMCVLGRFWGSKDLVRRCLDVYGQGVFMSLFSWEF